MLAGVIDEVGSDGPGDLGVARAGDHYGALVRSIVGQQLSTRSATAIYGRLTDRYGGRTPTPVEVLEDDPDELRQSVGLSHAKVAYLRSLAEHVLDGSLELERLDRASRRGGDRPAHRGPRHRAVERRHVPDLPSWGGPTCYRSAISASGGRS